MKPATTTLATWIMAILAAITLSSLPGLFGEIDDHSLEAAQAQDLESAIKTEAVEARFTRAARQICGDNAGYTLIDNDRTIQCATKRGHATRRVSL